MTADSLDVQRAWKVDGCWVSEKTYPATGAQLACGGRDCLAFWCRHRQAVVAEAMDAPLFRGISGHTRLLNLEVQPTQGFFVPVTLTRLGDTEDFTARIVQGEKSRRYQIDLGEFFASDGRIGIREMFIQFLRSREGLVCQSTAHPVVNLRKPRHLLDRWTMVTQACCFECAAYHNVSEDIPVF